jgi:hypothetical protein
MRAGTERVSKPTSDGWLSSKTEKGLVLNFPYLAQDD